MSSILFVYSTTDGHTRSICERLRAIAEAHGHRVTVVNVADDPEVDPAPFDKVVVGASIRYGKHSPRIVEFIRRRQAVIESKPNAFFSVNVVARKPDKNRPETNPYVRKFLSTIAWKPQRAVVFAGRIDYPRYGVFDRAMIRFIMWMTKGPTDPTATVEFTDWAQVEAFGETVSAM